MPHEYLGAMLFLLVTARLIGRKERSSLIIEYHGVMVVIYCSNDYSRKYNCTNVDEKLWTI